MKDIVSLCKRRGFIFPSSDIYNGINGFWDYGHLGILLKNNIRDLWWKNMVLTPPMGPSGEHLNILGLDSSIIQNTSVWKSSGHLDGFSDKMVDCKETKSRYRVDHLNVLIHKNRRGTYFSFEDDDLSKLEKIINNFSIKEYDSFPLKDIDIKEFSNILAPHATQKGTLTLPRSFNLMFKTEVGAITNSDNIAYLRPETAQGIFINYKNILDSYRVKLPFGIAQIGKAFRNEITPRNFIFRSREFEQMELEWFCHPSEVEMWKKFWKEHRLNWWKNIGIKEENIKFRNHSIEELSHYAKDGVGTCDIEYAFPFSNNGFGELEGISHRGNFDLLQHQINSGINLEYFDVSKNEKYIPHVIEPSAGLNRGVLAILCEAYTVDSDRPSGAYFKFSPKISPIKAAILPLISKDGLPEIANEIYMDLRNSHMVELDIKQNIGKRYARQDEIGTPFCLTIDHKTKSDECVTIRNRDTMNQERIKIKDLKNFLSVKIL